MAPSSGFPTDRRRSDCRSESHRPRTLRTRCSRDSMGRGRRPSRAGTRKRTQIAASLHVRRVRCALRPMRPAGVGVVRPEEPTGRAGGNRVEDGPKIGRVPRRVEARRRKCTEPVAPSSGFPTDRRRSGCRSESHQPRVLRTRCSRESTRARRPRQAPLRRTWRNLRLFLFAPRQAAPRLVCSTCSRRKRGRARGPSPQVRRAGNAFVHLPDEPSASA